jgi:hypothetical protein
MRFPIATRFMLLGVPAVLIGVCVTAAAFLWQDYQILRMVQRSYLGSVVQAAQAELRSQGHSPLSLVSQADHSRESIVHLKMRLQVVDVPPQVQDLGLRIEIVGPNAAQGLPPTHKSPFVIVHDTPVDLLPSEPDHEHCLPCHGWLSRRHWRVPHFPQIQSE